MLTCVINSERECSVVQSAHPGSISARTVHLSSSNQLALRHPWSAALLTLTAVQLASSGMLKGQTLVIFADVFQFCIMVVMVVGTAINIRPNRGAARGFWVLMTVSAVMWAGDYWMWLYYEVIRRGHMPTPQPGDTLLILHVVPVIMALALLPHRVFQKGRALSSNLGFALIACWWVFLYFHFAFAWQYLHFDSSTFHRNFNLLYHAELATAIIALFYLSQQSRNGWQQIYSHYLIAFLIYAPTSAIINILIQQNFYSSGGLWDLPLTISIAYLAWIGFRAYRLKPEPGRVQGDLQPGLMIPDWMAAIAAASIPAIALFSFERLHDPPAVRHFRIALSFTAMLVMAVLIFTRQHLLNNRLAHSLADSERAYQNLERLQTQVMQSERLASIGRLVSGAAHELNNPLTAILGYAELISSDQEVSTVHRAFAEKIAQQARRTSILVGNLLSFARQTAPQKRLTDLNSILKNACQLRAASIPARISLVPDLQSDLPLIMGDDNHLIQVVLHMLNNAVEAVEEVSGGEIVVRTQLRGEEVVLEVCDTGPGIAEPARVFDPFYTTKPPGQGTGLGLSACYGIVQEHEGTIECFNLEPRGAMFRISFKAVNKLDPTEAAAAS